MAYYNTDSQMRKDKEALEQIIRMRKNHNELKTNKGAVSMILLMVASWIIPVQFEAEGKQLGSQLRTTCLSVMAAYTGKHS